MMWRRIALTALLSLALFGFVYAFTLGGDEDAGPGDAAVEHLVPAPGSQTVRQAEIGVDLVPEWTALLVVNGIEIPEDQLRRVDAQNQVFFTPGPGKEIEQLDAGMVQVTALIWRPVAGESRQDAQAVRWTFRVV
ncbi:MAG TPA: hypothetical protein VGV63_12405 [Acidimicrobiales bacterium]|nr:hypothetical protein [Acidimicrobiales bacterium]